MAEPIIPASKQVRGSQDIPTLAAQEQLRMDKNVPNFSQALTNLAFTPTALGEFGQSMSQRASYERARIKGQELGKNPQGDILPPITDADRVFAQAYSAQSQATLGLQAQELINKSQEEVNSSFNLTPSLINSYSQNVAAGMENILNQAPSTIRGQLENQFSAQLMDTEHNLRMKMIKQEKAQTIEQAQLYNMHQMQQMHNAYLDNNEELANSIYQSSLAANKANYESGIWSATQRDTLDTQAKLQYYSSQQISMALDARQNKNLEGFLNGMIDKKPKELDWGEWEQVRNKVVGYIGAVENFQNRDQSLILSQANAIAAVRPLEPTEIEDLRNQLTPTRFNNFMAGYVSKNKKRLSEQNKQAALTANWHDADILSQASKKDLNAAFGNMVEEAKIRARNEGKELSDEQAQLDVASTAGVPIPAYIQKINNGLQSNNPELIEQNWRNYNALLQQSGQLTQGVKKESLAIGEMFNHFLEQGMDANVAAQNAHDTVLNKTPEQIQNNQSLIADWRKSKANDAAHRISWARKLSGVSKNVFMSNSPSLSLHMMQMMESNMQLTNGNVEVSEKMISSAMEKYYGTTKVNGDQEYSYMPVEKAVGIEFGAENLIRVDMQDQLQLQLGATKQAYDRGDLNFYYQIKNPKNFEDYKKAKIEVAAARNKKSFQALVTGKGLEAPTDLENQLKIIKEFEKNAPLEVEQISRDGTRTAYKVNIKASPLLQQSAGEDEIIGDYDITLRDDKGANLPLIGAFYGQQSHAVYRPNSRWIKDNYFALNNLNPTRDPSVEADLFYFNLKKDAQLSALQQRFGRGVF